MGEKTRKAKLAATHAGAAAVEGPSELPERWSAQRKTELVLRLLRGEALDAVSRESQVPAHELESWKRIFLETRYLGIPPNAPCASVHDCPRNRVQYTSAENDLGARGVRESGSATACAAPPGEAAQADEAGGEEEQGGGAGDGGRGRR